MTPAIGKTAAAEDGIAIRVMCCLLTLVAITTSFIFGRSAVPTINFSAIDGALLVLSIWLSVGGSMLSYHYRQAFPKPMKIMLNTGAILIAVNLARELWVTNVNADQFQFTYPLVNTLIATSVISNFDLRSRHDILISATFGLSLMALSGCSGRSMLFGAAVLLYIVLGGVLLSLVAHSSSLSANLADSRLVTAKCRGRYRPAVALAILLLPAFSLAAFSFVPRIDILMDTIVVKMRCKAAEFIYNARAQRADNDKAQTIFGNQMLAESPPNLKAHNPADFKQHGWLLTALPASAGKQDKAVPPPVEKLKAKIDGKKAEMNKPPALPAPGALSPAKSAKGSSAAKTKRAAAPPRPLPPNELNSSLRKNSEVNRGKPASGRQAKKAERALTKVPSPADNQFQAKTQPNRKSDAKASAHKLDRKSKAPAQSQPAAGKLDRQQPDAQAKAHAVHAGAAAPPAAANSQQQLSSATNSAPFEANPKAALPPTSAKATAQPAKSQVGQEKIMKLDNEAVNIGTPSLSGQQILMTLSCDRNVYLRAIAYDTFDGEKWTRFDPSSAILCQATLKGVDITAARSLQITDALPVAELVENITLKSIEMKCVPVGGIAKQLSLLRPVSVDGCGNLEVTQALLPGDAYTAVCDWPVFSLPDMRKAKSVADGNDEALSVYLKLPANQSRELVTLSEQLTSAGANRFQQAETIVAYLRQHCKYSKQPVTGGSGDNLADEFVFDTKSGDCKAFATAFCMLCRAAGIPARYVSGFSPGDFDPISGATLVRAKHAHAWAEIYMQPYGWIPFDATPGGMLPARPEQHYYDYKEVSRQAQHYAATTGRTVVSTISDGCRYLGVILVLLGALIGLALIGYVIWIGKDTLKHLLQLRRQSHPANSLRRRVIKQLKRLGVVETAADTGADILRRLDEVLAEQAGAARQSDTLRQSVCEFFTTYNAVVFGQEQAMDSLKTLTVSIEYQFRRN